MIPPPQTLCTTNRVYILSTVIFFWEKFIIMTSKKWINDTKCLQRIVIVSLN